MTNQNAKKQTRRIPKFSSREEEAHWFDTHDMADYQHEFKTAPVHFAKHLSSVLPVRFDEQTLGKLRHVAHHRGVGPTTLIRMWVLERMRQEQKQFASG